MNMRIWNPESPQRVFLWSSIETVRSDGQCLRCYDKAGELIEQFPMGRHGIEFTLDEEGAVT